LCVRGGERPFRASGADLRWCPTTADAGLIAYEMAMLVKRAGPHLVAQPRLTAGQMPAS
jgi:hypothetical protein